MKRLFWAFIVAFYCFFVAILQWSQQAELSQELCTAVKLSLRRGKAKRDTRDYMARRQHYATVWLPCAVVRRPLEFRGNQTMRNNYPRRQEITYHSPVTTISILISDPHGPISIVHLCLISVEIWKRNFVGVRLEDREN